MVHVKFIGTYRKFRINKTKKTFVKFTKNGIMFVYKKKETNLS